MPCLPRPGTAAQQHGNAEALRELPREGDRCLPRVPGGEEGKIVNGEQGPVSSEQKTVNSKQ